MDPIYAPLTKEKKQELLDRGYFEYEDPIPSKICNPNEPICKNKF